MKRRPWRSLLAQVSEIANMDLIDCAVELEWSTLAIVKGHRGSQGLTDIKTIVGSKEQRSRHGNSAGTELVAIQAYRYSE